MCCLISRISRKAELEVEPPGLELIWDTGLAGCGLSHGTMLLAQPMPANKCSQHPPPHLLETHDPVYMVSKVAKIGGKEMTSVATGGR